MGEGTRVNRGLDEHRREAARRLLPLLTAEERTCLRAELKVAEATTPEVELDAILEALSRLPRYRALALLLELAEPLASMLRDVATFLEHHGVAARTTGFVLGLPHAGGDVDLSPQVVGLVCSWPRRRLRSLGDDPFAELLRDWRWLRPGWDALAERARVRVHRGEIDLVETVIERKLRAARGEPPDPEPRRERERDLTDQDARAVAVGLLGRVEATAAVLRRIPADDRTASGRALMNTLKAALAETRRALALDDLTEKPRANAERTVALYRRQRFRSRASSTTSTGSRRTCARSPVWPRPTPTSTRSERTSGRADPSSSRCGCSPRSSAGSSGAGTRSRS